MGDIVNLNKFRKRKTRAQSEKQASENRVQFGRTNRQKTTDSNEVLKNKSDLDDKKLLKNKKLDENSDKED